MDDKTYTISRDSVTIDKDTYNQLIRESERYNTLVSLLFDAAVLSFDGNTLDFRTESVAAYLKAVEYNAFTNVIDGLKEEKC